MRYLKGAVPRSLPEMNLFPLMSVILTTLTMGTIVAMTLIGMQMAHRSQLPVQDAQRNAVKNSP